MRINFDTSDPFWSLQFAVQYKREQQAERIQQHIQEGNSIASFTWNAAEYHLDDLLDVCKDVLDAEIARREAKKIKKFWHFWKK